MKDREYIDFMARHFAEEKREKWWSHVSSNETLHFRVMQSVFAVLNPLAEGDTRALDFKLSVFPYIPPRV